MNKITDNSVATATTPAPQPLLPTFSSPIESVPSFYVNQAQVRGTIFDIQIVFGQFVDQTPESGMKISPQAVITMPQVHAKSLAKLLQIQVEEYEKRYGKLPDVPAPSIKVK